MLNRYVPLYQLSDDMDFYKGQEYFTREDIKGLHQYLKKEQSNKNYNPMMLADYLEPYLTLDDYNEDLEYPYDDLAELAEDHLVIVCQNSIIVSYEPCPFTAGLFDYSKE